MWLWCNNQCVRNQNIRVYISCTVLFRNKYKLALVAARNEVFLFSSSSLTTLSHSLEDITNCSWSPQVHSDHVMTIEELRLQMTSCSCFSCGVSWSDDHVSLDCSECGGYALERSCPICDGTCGAVWKRDLAMVSTSHHIVHRHRRLNNNTNKMFIQPASLGNKSLQLV